MIATIGLKSSIPARGIMRRNGARTGSVTRKRMTATIFDGRGENQDRTARSIMTTVSIWHSTLIRSKKRYNMANSAYSPSLLAFS